MRPRNKLEPRVYPGFNIRLAITDFADIKLLAETSQPSKPNRLLVRAVLEIVGICESSPLLLPSEGDLARKAWDREGQLRWRQLAERNVRRTLPNKLTQPIKLTFPAREREQLAKISRQLRWSDGQVIVEAIQAYGLLAGAEEPLEQLPDLIRLSRAEHSFMRDDAKESARGDLKYLNEQLGLIVRPKPHSLAPETQSEGIDDQAGLR